MEVIAIVKKIKDENGRVYVEKKPFYKKWWVWLLASVVIISANGGEDTNNDATNTGAGVTLSETTPSDGNAAEASNPVAQTYGIGQLVRVGDVEFTVNGIESAPNVGGEWGKTSKGTYLIVDLTVTNKGTESLRVDNSFFKLKNNDKVYESDASAGIYANEEESFFLSSINPDVSMSGKVVFDVSQEVIDSNTKQLEVSTGYWDKETGLINLQ